MTERGMGGGCQALTATIFVAAPGCPRLGKSQVRAFTEYFNDHYIL